MTNKDSIFYGKTIDEIVTKGVELSKEITDKIRYEHFTHCAEFIQVIRRKDADSYARAKDSTVKY